MTLPVLNATFKVLDGRVILGAALGLVDLVGDTLSRIYACLELVDVGVVGIADGLEQRLSGETCEQGGR